MLNVFSSAARGIRMKRPTIADIAQRAGVTKAAVSFALNGQPGVSAATRERILAIAQEIGFQPNSAARALTAGKAEAFGLIIDRPARTLGNEPFFMQLVGGIQAELTRQHITLLFTMAEDQDAEIEMYRRWWAQRRVDGVFVVDLQVNDRRIPVLEELHMPAVVVATAGLEAISVEADYTAEHGAQATRALLGSAEPPTAILYDNDVMAAAGLGVAQRLGVDVPGGVSIVSWDDSALCEVIHPALTALRRDIPAAGAQAARMLQEMTAGRRPANWPEALPTLEVRESSGPARPAIPATAAPAVATRGPRLTA